MKDKIFNEMLDQMRPDETLLRRLDAALAAEGVVAAEAAAAGAESVGAAVAGAESAGAAVAGAESAVAGAAKPAAPAATRPAATRHNTPTVRRPKANSQNLAAAAACLVVAVLAFGILFNAGTLAGLLGGNKGPDSPILGSGPVAVRRVAGYSQVYDQIVAIWQRPSANQNLFDGGAGSEAVMSVAPTIMEEDTLYAPAPTSGQAENTGADNTRGNYSDTNNQVQGIDEGDIIKTDGRYIYCLSRVYADEGYQATLSVIEAGGRQSVLLGQLVLASPAADSADSVADSVTYQELFLYGNSLAVLSTVSSYDKDTYTSSAETRVQLFDVSYPQNPQLVWEYAQSGWYYQARLTDGTLYIVSRHQITAQLLANDPGTYVPIFKDGEDTLLCPPESIAMMPEVDVASYVVVGSIDIAGRRLIDQASILGGSDTIYMSASNLYIASNVYKEQAGEPYRESVYTITEYSLVNRTQITRLALSDGSLTIAAQGLVDGSLLNQFALDEYEGWLRIAATVSDNSYRVIEDKDFGIVDYQYNRAPVSNAVYVLSPDLEVIGSLTGLAETENIYSVRFIGDIGYMVTFRQTDPLFAIDFSDPTAPRVLSALKIPGFSTYMHPWDDGLLFGLGQDNRPVSWSRVIKLSMFDVTDPTAVFEVDTLFTSIQYSESLHNHKAILVDPGRNLIGFGDSNGRYLLFAYQDGAFVQLADLTLGEERNALSGTRYVSGSIYGEDLRGLYIDDSLYVFSGTYLDVFSLDGFDLEYSVKLAERSTVEMYVD